MFQATTYWHALEPGELLISNGSRPWFRAARAIRAPSSCIPTGGSSVSPATRAHDVVAELETVARCACRS